MGRNIWLPLLCGPNCPGPQSCKVDPLILVSQGLCLKEFSPWTQFFSSFILGYTESLDLEAGGRIEVRAQIIHADTSSGHLLAASAMFHGRLLKEDCYFLNLCPKKQVYSEDTASCFSVPHHCWFQSGDQDTCLNSYLAPSCQPRKDIQLHIHDWLECPNSLPGFYVHGIFQARTLE